MVAVRVWYGNRRTFHARTSEAAPRERGSARLTDRCRVNHQGVTDPELIQRARDAGIATDYYDWRGQHVEVPAETLAAILEVLEQTHRG